MKALMPTAISSSNVDPEPMALKMLVKDGRWTCKSVMAGEYPEIAAQINPTLPDEKFRRVGQSAAAASLPELKK